ncbi:MAG: hypothetical protein HKN68_22335, partial [Saprospiraceae bacterium]|nr:hypothetical protein [Saprospiraceae bacterium]
MKSILSLSILICFTVTVYTQEVSVKDADNNVLMEIYDHGRTGSIFLKEGVILLTGFEDKLYNVSGKLYWNGLKLGTATEAAGWTLNGSNLYPTTLSTKVGIGTITPSHSFQVEGTSGNDITMALSNLSNSGYTQLLFGTEPTSDGSILLFGSSHLGSANKFRFRNNRGGGLFDWWLNGGVKMSLNRNGLLDVAGSMKIGNDGVTSSAGTMRYNAATQKFEGHNGIGWNTFGGAGKWSENGSDIYYNNGNVGIGTSSPGSMLHLYGNTTSPVELTIQNQDNAGSERIDFGISHSEQATIQVYGSSHALYPG